jgi:large subunit ribosomal protein L16
MRFVPTTVKKRPFKVWPKNKRFEVKLSNSQQYFPTNLPSITFLAHSSFYMPIVRFRRVVVKATAYGYLSSNSIEAFRKVIAPNFRKKKSKIYKFLIRCYSFLPLTKKPAEVRMGGGKGSKVRGFFCPVRPGQVLFEVFCRDPKSTKNIMLYASKKISVSTKVVFYLSQ